MKTILAGTDFTGASLNACRYAALVAQKLNCKLVVFNLYDIPVYHSNAGLIGITSSSLKKEGKKGIDAIIAGIKQDFPALKISYLESPNSMLKELNGYIKNHQVAAVVMGLEAKEKISKFVYGTHGVTLSEHLKVPVIIVPGKYTRHHLENIVLALDNTEKLSNSVSRMIGKFSSQCQLNLKVVHVRTPQEVISPAQITSVKIGTTRLSIELLKAPAIESGLKSYCARNELDLAAVVNRKHSVFYNFFSESTTKQIAFATRIPVMIIHT